MRRLISVFGFFTVLLLALPLFAQEKMQAPSMELQKEKLEALKMLDGTWRGTAWMITPTGQKMEMTQTERVGPMLDGTIRVIEGRGYDADGQMVFNAFAVVSYDTQKKQYTMRSYAQGRQGDFVLERTDDGFMWSIPAGPATIRYTAIISEGEWVEYGERIVGEQKPFKFLEMKLSRIGDTGWPASGAVLVK